ncbi:hypothetical protein BG006_009494 [Podila minutissima]|uniref:F-box domain-containing protein n=1 Tax=Podila minutissima TaxID=64525 RepID=A0A9P5VIV7_9FUNG|nr:hypothetical protein BG006_009494 [Podila minutissima]
MPSNAELNDLVCDRLDRKSLVKCALVNKQWYKTAMPVLFKDIPELQAQRQKESFRRLILEEHHWKEDQEQRKEETERKDESQKKEKDSRSAKATIQTPEIRAEAAIPKKSAASFEHRVFNSKNTCGGQEYGPCILTIPDVVDLFRLLLHQQPQQDSRPKASDKPLVFEVLECFLLQCTNLRIPKVELNEDHVRLPQLLALVVKYIVPVAEHLVIGRFDDERHKPDSKVMSEMAEDMETPYLTGLARLTKLQVLQLGHEIEHTDEIGHASGVVGDLQEECLDLTLESSLGALSTLKKLHQLNVECVHHHMDDENFKWMVDNWPEPETVWGIDCEDDYPHLMGESVL